MVGFKSIYLAKVTTHTAAAYATAAAKPLPYAGKMSLTKKETTQDLYYDDGLYISLKDLKGYDAELRVAQLSFDMMSALGLGEFDEDTNSFMENMSISGGEYSLRFIADTADHLPYYVNFLSFMVTSITPDNYGSMTESLTPNEWIITGSISNVQTTGLTYKRVMKLLDDKSNAEECLAFLTGADTYPPAEPGGD
jgi:hypothetical protein